MIKTVQYQFYSSIVKQSTETERQYLLYDTFARIHRKLKSVNFQSNLLIYVFIEELRFLFDAPVIRISYHDKTESNILENEYEVISSQLDINSFINQVKDTLTIAINMASSNVGKQIKNSNLENIDSVIILPILNSQDEVEGVVEIYFSRKSSDSLEAIVSVFEQLEFPNGQPIIKLLTEVFSQNKILKVNPNEDNTFAESPSVLEIKERFRKQSLSFSPNEFIEKYKEFFKPIDAVISILKEKLDSRLSNGIQPYSIVFSYRMPEDKDEDEKVITFFLTDNQVEVIVNESSDKNQTIEDLIYFSAFQYQEEQALSGYVLKTGYSDYTTNFSKDPRWTEWINNISGDQKQNVNRQLDLVMKFFGEKRHNAFLIPVYSYFDSTSMTSDLLVMVSITSEQPIDKWMRRRIFDLVWQSRVAIELSVILQRVSQEMIELGKLATVARINSTVGHELRQPLNLISGNAILLFDFLKKIQDKVEATEAFEIIIGSEGIEESLKEITQTLDKLVDADKVGTGNFNLDFCPCDINALIESTVKKFPNPKVTLRLSPNLPNANIDKDCIEKVLNNLISNAEFAINANSTVDGTVTISTILKEKHIEIIVSDNGSGIKPEILDKIFDMLFTTKQRGTGLGLAIVKGFIEAHEGKCWVESEFGKGTNFHFQLPCIPLTIEGEHQ